MADIVRSWSGAPRAPLRRVDDLLERIAALEAEADARSFRTLSYFLDIARIEAKFQADRLADEQVTGKRIPEDLWRPVRDDD